MSIAKELEVITKVKRGKGDEQEFLKKLLSAVADLPEKSWNSLSTEAQAWYNASVDATEASKQLAPLADFDKKETDSEAEGDPADTKAEETAADAKAEPEKPASKKSKPAKVKKEKPVKEKAPKKKGVARESMARINIVKCICKNPEISNEEIATLLEKDGVKVSKGNIQATAHYTRLVMKVLKEELK